MPVLFYQYLVHLDEPIEKENMRPRDLFYTITKVWKLTSSPPKLLKARNLCYKTKFLFEIFFKNYFTVLILDAWARLCGKIGQCSKIHVCPGSIIDEVSLFNTIVSSSELWNIFSVSMYYKFNKKINFRFIFPKRLFPLKISEEICHT